MLEDQERRRRAREESLRRQAESEARAELERQRRKEEKVRELTGTCSGPLKLLSPGFLHEPDKASIPSEHSVRIMQERKRAAAEARKAVSWSTFRSRRHIPLDVISLMSQGF